MLEGVNCRGVPSRVQRAQADWRLGPEHELVESHVTRAPANDRYRTTGLEGQRMDRCGKHNPALLWIALHDTATEIRHTARKNLNDHSNYGTRQAQAPGDFGC